MEIQTVVATWLPGLIVALLLLLMADALWDELVSISNVPMIQVARSTSR